MTKTASYRRTFRRHRRLLCLPIVLAVFLAAWTAFGSAKAYKSTASLWVDNPAPADSSLGNQNPAALPPAQQEQSVITELLTTRDFVLAVGHHSLLGHYLASHGPSGFSPSALLSRLGGSGSLASRIVDALSGSNVTATVPGPQVLEISYSGPTSAVAQSTLQAIVTELQRDDARFRQQHNEGALAYYRAQVQSASHAVASARDRANAYRKQHPGAGAGDPGLTALQTAQGLASTQLTEANSHLTSAASSLNDAGVGSGVHVVDLASAPTGPTGGKKMQLLAIFGGLFAGALISLLGTVALTPGKSTPWADELDADSGHLRTTGDRLTANLEEVTSNGRAEELVTTNRFLISRRSSQGDPTQS